MSRHYYVYIMTNKHNSVLYTGVTSDLKKRVYEHREQLLEGFTKNLLKRVDEHKNNLIPGFTSKYSVHNLVYYERYTDIYDAIAREKTIKGGSRQKKIVLINCMNGQWEDLYEKI